MRSIPLWSKLQAFSQHPIIIFLKKLIGDPVQLYSVFLVTTIMYYYHSEMNWLYTLLAVLMSWVMMRFYDFVAKHKFIGALSYIVYLFAGLTVVNMLTNWGRQNYPISFMVWFLTPQSVVEFSALYTISIYLLMLGFLTSAVYYFSKVRYRMCMQFLIMLIPLSLYAKENIHMPAVLVIILLSSFFLLMIYCRQLNNPKEIRYLPSFHGSVSIAAYVMMFSIIAAIVPKPAIQADREFIDNAMSYSTWSDILMNAISMFTETTDNTVGSSNNSRTIYYASAPESLRLRTQTYSYYLENDSWNVLENDYPNDSFSHDENLTYQPQQLLQAILDAASADADFAETYHLSEFRNFTLPEQPEYQLSLYTYFPMQVLPSPTRTTKTSSNANYISSTNTFSGPNFRGWSDVTYYPDSYARYSAVSPILQQLNSATYLQLLKDAQNILSSSPEQQKILAFAEQETIAAYDYLETVQQQDFQSEIVSDFARKITASAISDFDKALAIEHFFVEQDFVYDQSFQKPQNSNVEYFLSKSKTGVCYEYATAMVLLCRSIGLPARYVQGYNMSELYERNFQNHEINYVIKARDAHAFPEVYISGYGWLSFEPTVPSMELLDSQRAENQNVMLWGFVLLGIALLILAGYVLTPPLKESFFRKKLLTLSPEQCAAAIFQHMRQHLHLNNSTTVRELAKHSEQFYAEQVLFNHLDNLLYAKSSKLATDSAELASLYQNWFSSREQFLKEQEQLRRQEAKKRRAMKTNQI